VYDKLQHRLLQLENAVEMEHQSSLQVLDALMAQQKQFRQMQLQYVVSKDAKSKDMKPKPSTDMRNSSSEGELLHGLAKQQEQLQRQREDYEQQMNALKDQLRNQQHQIHYPSGNDNNDRNGLMSTYQSNPSQIDRNKMRNSVSKEDEIPHYARPTRIRGNSASRSSSAPRGSRTEH
jgi:hypothetical protein